MGGDMWISSVNFIGECETDALWEKRKKNMLKALEKYKTNLKDLEHDWIGFYEEAGNEVPQTYDQIKTDVKELIESFFSSILNSRETTSLYLPYRQIFLTGGMSWGDAPSDAAHLFDRFLYIPSEILKAGDVEYKFFDPIDMLLKVYENRPDSLKKELENYKCSEKV